MIFGNEVVLLAYGFLKTCFMMITNMKNHVRPNSDDHDADFRYKYREKIIAHFKQDFCNRSLCH